MSWARLQIVAFCVLVAVDLKGSTILKTMAVVNSSRYKMTTNRKLYFIYKIYKLHNLQEYLQKSSIFLQRISTKCKISGIYRTKTSLAVD
jgi:hypothetical protein